MAAILLQLIGKVHDADGFEGAFLYAYAASAAQHFGDYGFVAFYPHGFYSAAHHRAEANAKLIALFHFALVSV